MMAMLIGYNILFPAQEPDKPKAKPKTEIEANLAVVKPKMDSVSAKKIYGDFASASTGTEKDIVIENSVARFTFSTLGGKIKEVLLKKYKTFDQKPLYLASADNSNFGLELTTNKGKINTSNLYFSTDASSATAEKDKPQVVTLKLNLSENQYIEQTYTVSENSYEVGYDVKLVGLERSEERRVGKEC